MRVFISYRRSDSKDVAARIADNLAGVREIDHVFLDVDAIGHGEDFPERLDSEIRRSDVVIAVIGPGWAGDPDENGVTRIAREGDFVRREIATALETGKRVIPCLVNEAHMPGPDDLPSDIAALADRNACAIRHTTYRIDFEVLCQSVIGKRPVGELSAVSLGFGALWRGLAGLIVAALIALAVASFGMSSQGLPLETILGGRVPLVVFLIVLFALFQIGTYRYLRRYG